MANRHMFMEYRIARAASNRGGILTKDGVYSCIGLSVAKYLQRSCLKWNGYFKIVVAKRKAKMPVQVIDFERAIAERVAPRFNDIEQMIRKAGGGFGEQTRPF